MIMEFCLLCAKPLPETNFIDISYFCNRHLIVNDSCHFHFLRLQDYILSLCLNCLNIKVFNTLRSRQNGRHFAGDIFKHIHSLKPSDACMRQ